MAFGSINVPGVTVQDLEKWANENVLRLNGSQEIGEASQNVIRNTIGAATVFHATATVPNTGWQSYDGGRLVCINVSVPGIRESDVDGDFSVVQTGSEATDKPIRDALSLITRVKTMDDYIVVYATRIPSVAIPVKIEVIR